MMDDTQDDPLLLVHQRYYKNLELEKQLRALIEAKGPFDPSVRIIRDCARENYKNIILDDHRFSELHDVEQLLWRLHYKHIEEYRVRLRKNNLSSTAATLATTSTNSAFQNESHDILAFFKTFLCEASDFYHDLVLKIGRNYGLSEEFVPFEVTKGSTLSSDNKGVTDIMRCQISCHRCLIYLGDLARYKKLHTDGDFSNNDWSIAAGYYLQAALVWPSSGNPHNQLAVLATYMSNELLAIYRYFRSLATETPFFTARDNLILLFEKNQLHYLQLVTSVGNVNCDQARSKNGNPHKGTRRGDNMLPFLIADTDESKVGSEKQGVSEDPLTCAKILKNFRVRFVRLNGILFTRTSMETFSDVLTGTVDDMDKIFGPTHDIGGVCLYSDFCMGDDSVCVAALALQIVAILIFSIYNVTWGPDAHQSEYEDVLQRSVFLQHAFTASFHCTNRLIQKCADAKDASASPLLPAILIFLEWLACRPTISMELEFEEKQEEARLFFWRGLAHLLNKLLDSDLIDTTEDDFTNAIASHSNPFQVEREWRVALWEDHELQGFMPLAPSQLSLQYYQGIPTSFGNRKERMIRVWRLILASKFVSSLEENERGMVYDQEAVSFYMKGDKSRMKSRKKREGELPDTRHSIDRSENLPDAGFISSVKDQHSSHINFLPSNELGEDEDEVIVYKPLKKTVVF